jgi:hypothetical protein
MEHICRADEYAPSTGKSSNSSSSSNAAAGAVVFPSFEACSVVVLFSAAAFVVELGFEDAIVLWVLCVRRFRDGRSHLLEGCAKRASVDRGMRTGDVVGEVGVVLNVLWNRFEA